MINIFFKRTDIVCTFSNTQVKISRRKKYKTIYHRGARLNFHTHKRKSNLRCTLWWLSSTDELTDGALTTYLYYSLSKSIYLYRIWTAPMLKFGEIALQRLRDQITAYFCVIHIRDTFSKRYFRNFATQPMHKRRLGFAEKIYYRIYFFPY